MSSLWTPEGERPVRRDPPASPPPSEPPAGPGGRSGGAGVGGDEPSEEERRHMAEQLEELQSQLAQTPAAVVVSNHAFGLFELAAVHLSTGPPQLDQAKVAIDAMAALVEGMRGRLGEAETQLTDALAQLRLAFVQVKAAARGTATSDGTATEG